MNVRVEVTVTDQIGSRPPATKLMSLTVANGDSAMIRNEAQVPSQTGGVRPAPFSLDAAPQIEHGQQDRFRLSISLVYDVVDPSSPSGLLTQVRARQSVLLESGKPVVISQSTDPITDRKVTVEVKATILK